MVVPELFSRTFKAIGEADFSSWLDISIWNDTEPMRRLIMESVSLQLIRQGAHGWLVRGSVPHLGVMG